MKKAKRVAQISSAPTVVRYCKKCNARTGFASSGMFRVNAQKKSLDVWLIYKCRKCNTKWNLTVMSRVAPGAISLEMLNGFHENDEKLAMQYATDTTLIKKNGAKPGKV